MPRTAGSAGCRANGPLHLGWKIAYTPSGIVVALIFIGLPFVVRTVQPVLEEFEQELEEAAATLGANRFQTITRVILPRLTPAILTGFALAFARAVGEYGSVIFIASNLPNKSEIAPLLIIIKLEEFDDAGRRGDRAPSCWSSPSSCCSSSTSSRPGPGGAMAMYEEDVAVYDSRRPHEPPYAHTRPTTEPRWVKWTLIGIARAVHGRRCSCCRCSSCSSRPSRKGVAVYFKTLRRPRTRRRRSG